MNKKHLTKTIVYFVLALVIIPVCFAMLTPIIALFIPKDTTLETRLQIVRIIKFVLGSLILTFLILGVINLIKLLGDEEDSKEEKG